MSGEFIVVKHGSSVVENADSIGIDQTKIESHVRQHVSLRGEGLHTVEVASGAVVEGKEQLQELGQAVDGWPYREIAGLGTFRQMGHWEDACRFHNMLAKQVLATHREIDDASEGKAIVERIKKTTLRGALVIVNENDAASDREMDVFEEEMAAREHSEEESEADNDWLAAHLAMSLGAKTLLLLGNKDGFEIDGQVLPTLRVASIDEVIQYCDGSSNSGKGGMKSKLQAAGKAAAVGIDVVIGNAFTDYRQLLGGGSGTRVVK